MGRKARAYGAGAGRSFGATGHKTVEEQYQKVNLIGVKK